MPEEWAASGARLLLPITVEFDSVPYPGEPEALVGRTCFRVRPLGDASFVGVGGKVTVPVRGGAWAIQPPKPPQKPALLRFWLEFPGRRSGTTSRYLLEGSFLPRRSGKKSSWREVRRRARRPGNVMSKLKRSPRNSLMKR